MYGQQAGGLTGIIRRQSVFGSMAISGLVFTLFLMGTSVSAKTGQNIISTFDDRHHFVPSSVRGSLKSTTTNSEMSENTNKNHSAEIGVWFYANRYLNKIPNVLVDELAAWKINTIYFAGTDVDDWNNQSTRNAYSNFIRYANDRGMKVYAVTLEDPSFALKTSAELEKTFRGFINITRGLFDTYVIDVEPHAIVGPDVHTFIPEYIRMSHILGRVSQDEVVRYIDTVPYWYHAAIRELGISSGLDVLASDGVNLMTYSYTSHQTLENIKKIQSEIKMPVTISIKITPGQKAPHLKTNELLKAIDGFNSQRLNFTLYEAQYILSR